MNFSEDTSEKTEKKYYRTSQQQQKDKEEMKATETLEKSPNYEKISKTLSEFLSLQQKRKNANKI